MCKLGVSKNDTSHREQQRRRDKRRQYKDKKKAKKETISCQEDVLANQAAVEPADLAGNGEQLVAAPAFDVPLSPEAEALVEIMHGHLNQTDGKSVALQ